LQVFLQVFLQVLCKFLASFFARASACSRNRLILFLSSVFTRASR
jgi:hypothetical protein